MLFHEPGRKNLRLLDISTIFMLIYVCSWYLMSYFLITSCFFCSSDVGKPSSFCLWSYIIFSTRPLVSPSRSESLLGSGFTFFVLISGSQVTTCAHHCILFTCENNSKILAFSDRKIEVRWKRIALISESWKLICFKYLSLIGNKEN